ncbi:hypothetical protein LTS18_013242, partial [Coniosporium uncinatum]
RSRRPQSMFPGAASRSRSRSGNDGGGGPFARMARAVGGGDGGSGQSVGRRQDRGRSDDRREGHVRAKSREERRQEIELGQIP